MTDVNEIIKLARAFGEQMQGALTTSQFRAMCDANKCETNIGICHSHDYCDANMEMLVAFEETYGRNPLDGRGDEGGMNEADTQLWNDAWTVAKAAEFFA